VRGEDDKERAQPDITAVFELVCWNEAGEAPIFNGRIGRSAEGLMPLPYSADLRERVLLAHEHGEGNAATLARRFRVAVNTVKNWVRAAVTEGRRVAKPMHHGPAPRLGTAEREILCRLVAAKTIAPEDLVFLDETGVSTDLTRLYARAPCGQRAYDSAPGHWKRVTVLGALALCGVVCAMTVPAATDWPVFQAFLQQVVIPTLHQHKPGATLVMDHLAAHRLRQARPLLEEAGFALPPPEPVEGAVLFLRAVADRALLVQAQGVPAHHRAALDPCH
jgi:transposase